MSLIKTLEELNKRSLTSEEVTRLTDFQKLYLIDDDDPLIVVLALMAQSQLLVQSIPDLLQKKAVETIELHRTLLREQSVTIAKELIQTVGSKIQESNRTWQMQWAKYFGFFIGGAISIVVINQLIRYF